VSEGEFCDECRRTEGDERDSERDRILRILAWARSELSHCSARWVLDRIEEKVKNTDA